MGNQGQGEDDGDVGAEVAHGTTELRPDGGLEAEVGGEAVAPPLTLEERWVGGFPPPWSPELSLTPWLSLSLRTTLKKPKLVPNFGFNYKFFLLKTTWF